MKIIIVLAITIGYQLVTSQILRQPQYNLINRPLGEKIIETGNFINQATPTVISEPPCNSIVPIPNVASPSTTIITDCSPTICQNLANTIQLMIVCNLLQNSRSSELAMQLAAPILNEVMTSPVLSCGCNNPLSPNVVAPNVVTNYVPPNFVTPNIVSPNLVAPNIVSPNLVAPNIVSANFVAPTPNVISPNLMPLPPRVVAPANPCPNSPVTGPVNAGLLNTILGMLGNIQT